MIAYDEVFILEPEGRNSIQARPDPTIRVAENLGTRYNGIRIGFILTV